MPLAVAVCQCSAGSIAASGVPRFNDIRRGKIVGTTTNGLVVRDQNGRTSTMPFGAFAHFAAGWHQEGEDFVIFGPRDQRGTINPQGIRSLGQ
jgi:hypothetical protein